MTCYLDRLVPPTWLKVWRGLCNSRAISITPPARPNRPAKLDCPGPSDLQLWTARLWLLGPSSSNLGAWTCKSSTSAWEWHRIRQITLFWKKWKLNWIYRPRVTSKPSPRRFRPSRGGQSEPKVLQKAASGLHFCVFFQTFCTTWAHELSRFLPASNFDPKRPFGLRKTCKTDPPEYQKHNKYTHLFLKTYQIVWNN